MHPAILSRRADYSVDNVGSLNGIEGQSAKPSQFTSENNKSNRKELTEKILLYKMQTRE